MRFKFEVFAVFAVSEVVSEEFENIECDEEDVADGKSDSGVANRSIRVG